MRNSIVLIFLSLSFFVSAQQVHTIEIINANTIEFNKKIGNGAQRLLGDVHFRHQNMDMYCDSAYYYSEDDSLHAFSNIHMIQGDTLHVYGDFMRYDGQTNIAQIRKNVKMIDKESTLTTEFLDYNLKTKIGYYFNGGHIVNKENVLNSKKGYYHSKVKTFYFRYDVNCTNTRDTIITDTLKYNTATRIAYFFGPTDIFNKDHFMYTEDGWYNTISDNSEFSKNSYIVSNTQTIMGDSLFYNGKLGQGIGKKHVTITDTSRNIIMKGHYGYTLRENDYSFITDSALFINYDDKDSLFLHGDTIVMQLDSTGEHKIMKAYNDVRFFRTDLQGQCDSLVYTQVDSIMRMYEVPIIWSDENQLTGEFIELYMKNGAMEKAILYTTPFIVSQEDSSFFNQIRGKLMTGYFRENKLYKIYVVGNGQTIYYPRDNGEMIGINKADCSDMIIYINQNKVKQIDFLKEPVATLYPVDQAPMEELILKGFVWYPDIRPLKKEDIFIPKKVVVQPKEDKKRRR